MEKLIAPSILSADFTNLGKDISQVEKAGAKWLHIDVMDGNFVPNISFGFPVIQSIRKSSGLFFDVHLMIVEPERYIGQFARAGADMITIHAESCTHLDMAIEQIKKCGAKAGVALNPATPLAAIEYVLDKTDMVLVMTVNPGYGGQPYIPYSDRKIRSLRQIIDGRNPGVLIEVDGGIKLDNIAHVKECGADVFVSGSAVFDGNIADNFHLLSGALGQP